MLLPTKSWRQLSVNAATKALVPQSAQHYRAGLTVQNA